MLNPQNAKYYKVVLLLSILNAMTIMYTETMRVVARLFHDIIFLLKFFYATIVKCNINTLSVDSKLI